MALVDLGLQQFSWLEMAACKGTDPGLFFPDGTTTPEAQEKIDEAKSVCNICECQSDCLDYAIQTNQSSGIWGGKSETERHQIRRENKRNKAEAVRKLTS